MVVAFGIVTSFIDWIWDENAVPGLVIAFAMIIGMVAAGLAGADSTDHKGGWTTFKAIGGVLPNGSSAQGTSRTLFAKVIGDEFSRGSSSHEIAASLEASRNDRNRPRPWSEHATLRFLHRAPWKDAKSRVDPMGRTCDHRPKPFDRCRPDPWVRLWAWLSRIWKDWRSSLVIVKPDTVVSWHRQGFRLYWRWKSRHRGDGRPAVPREVRDLIRRMSKANSLWGAPRIHGELLKLGIEVSQATVSKYRVRHRKPPSRSWRAFLNNHAKDLVSIDFFTVPTVTFNVLFVFVVLAHDRRRIVHFNVTESPGAKWTAQQIVEAFPWDTAPRFLLRDRDGIYGHEFISRVDHMGIKQVKTAARSPWHNPYVERMIGTLRRDCLDHVIVLNDHHLRRILREYLTYYHGSRTHLSLDKDSPKPRIVEPSILGRIVEFPMVGGLHHRYSRLAA